MAGPLKITGMAFQSSSLLPWRTTLDNVLLPLEIVEPLPLAASRRSAPSTRRRRAKLLQSVGLGGYEDKFPWELSGGMQQRASICRALIHEPKMLLLDEPFGALDAFTREELWCILRDLLAAQRFNVILVTHDLREAVFLADTVYVMSRSPGRMLVRREIDLPRPRALELTYTQGVHRHRARAARAHRRDPQAADAPARRRRGDRAMTRRDERALGAVAAARRRSLAALGGDLPRLRRLGVHLPEPVAHRRAAWSSSAASIAGHAWRTFWVTMVGFGIVDRRRHAARLPDRQLAHSPTRRSIR